MKKMDEMELHIERTAAWWAYRYSFVFLSLWCLGGLLQGWKSGLSAGDAFSEVRIPFLLLITQEAVHDGAVLICRAKASDDAAQVSLKKNIMVLTVCVLLLIWFFGSALELAF